MSPLLLLLSSVFGLLLLRVPVAFAMLLPSVCYLLASDGSMLDIAVPRLVASLNSFTLTAVPLFILLGGLANAAGVTRLLFDFAEAAFGRVRGSLGYVNIAVSFGFSWMSGTAVGDAAGMGRLEIPAMVERGYSKSFAAGVTASSSLVSPVMPPSIPAVIFALSSGVSLGALLLAGILPATMMALSLCIVVFIHARGRDDLRGEPASRAHILRAAIAAIPALLAPVILIGGILGGVFTPTEAAGVSVLYVALLGILTGRIRSRLLTRCIIDAAATTGGVLLIVASASLMSWIIAIENGPALLSGLLPGSAASPLIFLLMMNVICILVGMFVDPTSAILVLVPVLLPTALSLGVDPLHFGIVMIVNLMIGLLTPPVGIVLYVICSVAQMPFSDVVRGTIPFLIPLICVLLLLTFFPGITLFLPRSFGF